MQVVNDTLIQVPTITGWKCDVCGETFFDARAVRQLNALIGNEGPPPNRHTSASAPVPSEAAHDESADTAQVLRPPPE